MLESAFGGMNKDMYGLNFKPTVGDMGSAIMEKEGNDNG